MAFVCFRNNIIINIVILIFPSYNYSCRVKSLLTLLCYLLYCEYEDLGFATLVVGETCIKCVSIIVCSTYY